MPIERVAAAAGTHPLRAAHRAQPAGGAACASGMAAEADGQAAHPICLRRLRRRFGALAGPLRFLRRVEHAAGGGRVSGPVSMRSGPGRSVALVPLAGVTGDAAAHVDRHGGIRPRHRRRPRAGLGAPRRRRPRHRQVDHPDPGRRGARPRRQARRLCLRRRGDRSDPACAPSGWACATRRSSSPPKRMSRTSSRRCRSAPRSTSSSSIPSRRCGRIGPRARPAR